MEVSGQFHTPAALPLGKEPLVPIGQSNYRTFINYKSGPSFCFDTQLMLKQLILYSLGYTCWTAIACLNLYTAKHKHRYVCQDSNRDSKPLSRLSQGSKTVHTFDTVITVFI